MVREAVAISANMRAKMIRLTMRVAAIGETTKKAGKALDRIAIKGNITTRKRIKSTLSKSSKLPLCRLELAPHSRILAKSQKPLHRRHQRSTRLKKLLIEE